MTNQSLFQPYELGSVTLANRIVMAPLTRNRAGAGLVPGELAATYYAQRATAGLLITEATQISAEAQGYQDTPGIYTQAQIEGWRKVTDAVHARGGRIFVQLWHTGRISHVDLQPEGAAPGAPSAIRAETKTFVNNHFVDVSEPRALELKEIKGIVADFRKASANAITAGFNGVEIHGANGYLLEQFLKDGANQRTDEYGGSVENRARLLLEVVEAVKDEIGAARTGVRISPVSPANAISCSDPQPQYDYLAEQLDASGIVYLHVVEGATEVPVMPHRLITLRCVAALKTPTSVTMAMTWRWRLTILHRTKPICSRSVAPSFLTPISSKDLSRERLWPRLILKHCMAVVRRATPTIHRLAVTVNHSSGITVNPASLTAIFIKQMKKIKL